VSDLRIRSIEAIAVSAPMSKPVALGVGRAVKREAVIVKIITDDGIVGWGEAHHCRSPLTVQTLINVTLADLLVGQSAAGVNEVWERVYRNQLVSHGAGAAAVCALSGIDMALWDIRGKAVGWPLYQLLGGVAKEIPTYAGGVSLGYTEPEALLADVFEHLEAGFTAVKLRVGDTVANDIMRVTEVRERVGNDVTIMVDANTRYSLEDLRAVLPAFKDANVRWIEEPFPPFCTRLYKEAAAMSEIPLAAGENHYTRFSFQDLIDQGAVDILQPDLSKTGGVTEAMRVGAMASAVQLPVCPHTCVTGLNMAATIHVIASLPTGWYFEADVAPGNQLRDRLCSQPYEVSGRSTVRPLDKPGIGVEVDEDFLRSHPVTEGDAFQAA
jgi:D-galactarolactone cycloisomerase